MLAEMERAGIGGTTLLCQTSQWTKFMRNKCTLNPNNIPSNINLINSTKHLSNNNLIRNKQHFSFLRPSSNHNKM